MNAKKNITLALRRTLAFTLVLCLCFPTCTTAFATEISIDTIANNGIMPLDEDIPIKHHNLSNSDYEAVLVNLAATMASETQYYFSTSSGQIEANYELQRVGNALSTNRKLQIKLYQRSSTGSWTLHSTKTVTFNNTTTGIVTFTGLSANYFYYISFYNNSSALNLALSGMDISGTIIITD